MKQQYSKENLTHDIVFGLLNKNLLTSQISEQRYMYLPFTYAKIMIDFPMETSTAVSTMTEKLQISTINKHSWKFLLKWTFLVSYRTLI